MTGHNDAIQRWLRASKIPRFINCIGGFTIFCVLKYRYIVIRRIAEDKYPDSSTFDTVNTSSAVYCFEDYDPPGCQKGHASTARVLLCKTGQWGQQAAGR